MTVSIWQELDTPLEERCQDLVIGAGLVGAWTATALTARGRDVVLTDARGPAAGASGRNGGFVMTNQREHYPDLVAQRGRDAARELLGMVRRNVQRMRELATRYGIPLEEGVVRLARDAAYADELERWARALEADGVPVDFQRGDPTGMGHLAAMAIEGDFATQPARLTEALVAHCGARTLFDNEIFALAAASDGRGGVVARGRRARVRCDNVFICLNGYAGALHPWLAARVRPARGQILVTPPAAPGLVPMACISGLGYLRQRPDGRIMIGGARALFEEEEYTAADWNTPALLQALLDELARLFGDRVEPCIERAWSGTQGFTPDRAVIVGALPAPLERAFFAVGFSGYGNSIGLEAAERMVELALEGRSPGPLCAHRATANP